MKRLAIEIGVIILVLLSFYLQHRDIVALRAERDRYRGNTETLLQDIEQFAVRDSLSAARVGALELTLDEFKRWRADDAALVKDLKIKNKELAAINAAQAETIIRLSAVPRDTIVLVDSVLVPAVAVHCGDAWYDFDGLLTEDAFTGRLASRDSLLITEAVKYKRFLGFLWRTNKVKSREMTCASRNPHTKILSIEYIIISN